MVLIFILAILLGLLQGFAEFLPVSSSGHLAVVQYVFSHLGGQANKEFFGNGQLMTIFDVSMHFPAVLAILLFFRKRIVDLFKADNRRILGLIIVGFIPTMVVGALVAKLHTRDAMQHMPVLVGVCFLITAALLKMTDSAKEGGFELKQAGWKRALLAGSGQAMSAALPGVSRSGSTISTGLFAGLKREDAVAFSFFLAIPAFLGASLVEGWELLKDIRATHDYGSLHLDVVLVGCVVAFFTYFVAIKLLILVVRMKKLSWFAYYMLLAAAATFVVAFIYR